MITTQRQFEDLSLDLKAMRSAEIFVHNNPEASYQNIMLHIKPILDKQHDISMWIVDWILYIQILAKEGRLKELAVLNPKLLEPRQPSFLELLS